MKEEWLSMRTSRKQFDGFQFPRCVLHDGGSEDVQLYLLKRNSLLCERVPQNQVEGWFSFKETSYCKNTCGVFENIKFASNRVLWSTTGNEIDEHCH